MITSTHTKALCALEYGPGIHIGNIVTLWSKNEKKIKMDQK